MVLIGSTALSHYVQDIVPNDLDLVGTYDEAVAFRKEFKAVTFFPINSGKSFFMSNTEGKICEIEIAWPGSRAEKFVRFCDTQLLPERWGFMSGWRIVPRDVLYLLKMSHRYLKDSPHFLKTMRDIHMLRDMGCTIREEHQEYYQDRMKDTYTYAHPKLNQAKEGFFDTNQGVEYTFDHDSIHEAVKHFEKPAYQFFKPTENEVMCSKDLFFGQEEHIRLAAVVEESYVLALERSLIPYPVDGKTPKEAFDMALMKVCTSITSGWFREYAWENYYAAQDMYNEDYVAWFKQGLLNGTVKPFDKSKSTY